ncbi:MAG: hypothetical protein PHW75_03385 [Patescibacteria group bacterium]|nr:hypothetical protein [Patescibacteria group bacterium]
METDRSTKRRMLAKRWRVEEGLGGLGILTLSDAIRYFGVGVELSGDLADLRLPLFLELELRRRGITTIAEVQAGGERLVRSILWYDTFEWTLESGQRTVDFIDFALIGRGYEPLS